MLVLNTESLSLSFRNECNNANKEKCTRGSFNETFIIPRGKLQRNTKRKHREANETGTETVNTHLKRMGNNRSTFCRGATKNYLRRVLWKNELNWHHSKRVNNSTRTKVVGGIFVVKSLRVS
jgi:hypothetical protein